MKTRLWGHESEARCDGDRLTVSLSRSLFRPEVWRRVVAWFEQRYEGWSLLQAPFRVITAEGVQGQGPCWKQSGLDLLSGLVFVLFVPPEHRPVRLWQTLDWAAINRLCADCYQNQRHGQRAWAPAQVVAGLYLFFVAPVVSERQLVQVVGLTPLYRWFCGLSLFGAIPDHSTLYTFRQRLGVERFEALFTWVVLRCQEGGLIGHDLVHYDMTLVRASTQAWTPYQRAVIAIKDER